MDFFEHQDLAQRQSRWLVGYFALAVAGVILALYLVVLGAVYALNDDAKQQGDSAWVNLDHPTLFGGVAALVGTIIFGVSAVRLVSLSRGGGRAIAESVGGRLVSPGSADPAGRRVLNVVEEMALASGVPVPAVYIIEDDSSINAFAAGNSQTDAVIGVTRGCARLLARQELQGVVAHEFSHILHGDMVLNMRLIGVLFGIVFVSQIGRFLMEAGFRCRNTRAWPLGLFGAAVWLVGSLGAFFAELIQMAISRQREFLADASAVQFTRDPSGIAGALRKVAALRRSGTSLHPAASGMAHMMFNDPRTTGLSGGALSSHPPIEDRILRLDPAWDGTIPSLQEMRAIADAADAIHPRSKTPPDLAAFDPDALDRPRATTAAATPALAPGGALAENALCASEFLARAGTLGPQHLYYAAAARAAIPAPLREAAHDAAGACGAVLALLLSHDPDTRAAQTELIRNRAEPAVAHEAARLDPIAAGLDPNLWVAAIDLCIPALRFLSTEQFDKFRADVEAVAESDGALSLPEFVMLRCFGRHLDAHFHPCPPPKVEFRTYLPVVNDAVLLLSALAWVGADDEADAAAAFRAGVGQIHIQVDRSKPLPADACNLGAVEAAMDRLTRSAPVIRKNFLYAAACTIACDRAVTVEEGHLIRAIADTFDLPVPPLVHDLAPRRRAPSPPSTPADPLLAHARST